MPALAQATFLGEGPCHGSQLPACTIWILLCMFALDRKSLDGTHHATPTCANESSLNIWMNDKKRPSKQGQKHEPTSWRKSVLSEVFPYEDTLEKVFVLGQERNKQDGSCKNSVKSCSTLIISRIQMARRKQILRSRRMQGAQRMFEAFSEPPGMQWPGSIFPPCLLLNGA